jgi:hypothetical protein
MRKRTSAALVLSSLCAWAWLAPNEASAVPKMDVKVALGVGSTTLVPRIPDIDLYDPETGEFISTIGGRHPRTFANWGLQLGARVTAGKIFGEMAIGFSRFYFEVTQGLADIARAQGTNSNVQDLVGQQARMNSLEIPLTAGYVPYKNPYFKLFLYGGWVSTFNLRGFVNDRKFRPKEIPGFPLSIYVAGARFGTQFDLGPFNVDFNYTISMNSFTKTEFRTNAHVFKFFLGWLF